MPDNVLIIDNFDSFTYNLYQLLASLGARVDVIRNDEVRYEQIEHADFNSIVISPGPGNVNNPNDLGVVTEVLKRDQRPILGVCLGHQAMAAVEGGRVLHAPEPVHGRVSDVQHNGRGLFAGLPNPLKAVRYHSWIVGSVPPCLAVDAQTSDGLIMALHHRSRPRWGVQFHPESICTEAGLELASNFLSLARNASPSGRVQSPSEGKARQKEIVAPVVSRPLRQPARRARVRWLDVGQLSAENIYSRVFGFREGTFWLDSARVAEGLSRFSYMGSSNEGPAGYELRYDVQADQLFKRRGNSAWHRESGDIFEHMKRLTPCPIIGDDDLPFGFRGGFVGYLGYELKSLGGEACWGADTPDASMLFVDRFIVIDHAGPEGIAVGAVTVTGDDAASESEAVQWFDAIAARIQVAEPACQLVPSLQARPVGVTMRHDREAYLRRVEQCKQLIREGESYELCLTNRLDIDVCVEPSRLYGALRDSNPAPYAAFMRFDGHWLCSSSPERFIKMDVDGLAEAKPIKGTIRRGATASEDAELKQHLMDSEKDFAENLMIVDLLRHDLGAQCEVGSIAVPALAAIESYATVHQMVSTIRGRRRSDVHPVDLLRCAFPAGSMTGAPKDRTMRLLDEIEDGPRGIYSGALGYIGLDGAADLSVVIRTLVATDAGLSLGCGGAVTILSDADAEYDEMLLKAAAPLAAIARCVTGRADGYVIEQSPRNLFEEPCQAVTL